MLITLL